MFSLVLAAHKKTICLALICLAVSPSLAMGQAGVPYVEEDGTAGAGGKATSGRDRSQLNLPEPTVHHDESAPEVLALRGAHGGFAPAHFHQLWQARRASMEQDDENNAQAGLAQIHRDMLAAGWPNAFGYAAALVHEGKALWQEGAREQAEERLAWATQLAPDLPSAWQALGAVRLRRGDIRGGIGALVAAADRSFTASTWAATQQAAGAMAAAAGLMLALLLLCLASVLLYARSIVHDLVHLLPAGSSAWLAAGLLVAALVLPWLAGSGLLGTLLVCCAWGALYYKWNQRLAASLALCATAVSALLLPFVFRAFVYPGSYGHQAYLASVDVLAEQAAEYIESSPIKRPEGLLALAVRAERANNLSEAGRLYQEVLSLAPGLSAAHTGLGNLMYKAGRYDAALAAYEEALRASQNVATLYNLSLTYHAVANLGAAEATYQRAQEIDSKIVSARQQLVKKDARAALMPTPLDGIFKSRVRELAAEEQGAADALWSVMGGAIPASRWVLLVLASILFMLTLGGALQRALRLSQSCTQCGRVRCARCEPEAVGKDVCAPCQRAAAKDAGIDPQQRELQQRKIARFARRRVRWTGLTMLIPGGTWWHRGQWGRAALVSGIFGTALFGLVALPAFPAGSVHTAAIGVWTVLSGAVCVAVVMLGFIAGLRTILRMKG